MGMFGILEITAAGLDVQQARLEATAGNIANANTTAKPGEASYQPLTVVVGSIATGLGHGAIRKPSVIDTVPIGSSPRMVHDPSHPYADKNGNVMVPDVDTLSSMLDLMSISRNYEANLRAFDITRTLLQRTLDIGNRK